MVMTSYFLLPLPLLLPPLDFSLTIMNYYYNQAIPISTRLRGILFEKKAEWALLSIVMRSALRQSASQLIDSAILRLHLYYRIAKFARKGRFACYNPLRMRYSLQAARERFDLAFLSGIGGVSPGNFPNNE